MHGSPTTNQRHWYELLAQGLVVAPDAPVWGLALAFAQQRGAVPCDLGLRGAPPTGTGGLSTLRFVCAYLPRLKEFYWGGKRSFAELLAHLTKHREQATLSIDEGRRQNREAVMRHRTTGVIQAAKASRNAAAAKNEAHARRAWSTCK